VWFCLHGVQFLEMASVVLFARCSVSGNGQCGSVCTVFSFWNLQTSRNDYVNKFCDKTWKSSSGFHLKPAAANKNTNTRYTGKFRLITDHEGPEGSRGIAVLFL